MKTLTLRPVHLLGPLLCLLPLGLAALQDPKPSQDPTEKKDSFSDDDFYGSEGKTVKTRGMTKKLQGCWKLEGVKSEDYPDRGIDLLGYLLISGPFISLEVQAFWDDTMDEPPEDAFETFIGEFKPVGRSAIEVRILMGSFLDREEGSLEWYQSDKPERFAVELPSADTLVLEWKGKRKMTFRRHRGQAQIDRDFFGANTATGDDDFYNHGDDLLEDEAESEMDEDEVMEGDDPADQ